MSKQCKCEHWQQCPICMPHRFDADGKLLPPELNPLQAARSRIEELEHTLFAAQQALITEGMERDALLADNERLREVLSWYVSFNGVVTSGEAEEAEAALAATPAQSLARVRNQVLEKCSNIVWERYHAGPEAIDCQLLALKEPE